MIYGYLVSLGWILLLIGIFGLIRRKCALDVEISRKVLHILIGFTWVFMDIFWGRSYHQIVMCGIFVILNALSLKFKLFSAIERSESNKNHPGTVYYALAMLVLAVASYFYEPLYLPFGMAVMCLSFGDGFAPIVAKIFKKHNLELTADKTIFGTLACIIFSFIAAVVFNACYRLEYGILTLFALATIVGIAELFSIKGLDNFGITFSAAAFLWAYGQGYFDNEFLILVILSACVILLILIIRALTVWGSFGAYVMLIISSICVGYRGFLLYVIPFALIGAVGFIRTAILKSKGRKSGSSRNLIQVMINGGITLIMLIVYRITFNIGFVVLAVVSLAECFVDSVASDVGSLSPNKPFDVIRFKRVDSGVSGGISLLGTLSALASCVIMGGISMLFAKDLRIFGFVSGFSFLGMFIDSIIGSIFQSLYRCVECGAPTESKNSCKACGYGRGASEGGEKERKSFKKHSQTNELIKGIRFVDNNVVNLIANVLTVALAVCWFI